MAASTAITDYVGVGLHSARPTTPNVPTGCTAIYYETDTTNVFAWSGTAWVQINGSGGGGLTAPSIVQVAIAAGTISAAVFATAPTAGNLLVAFSQGAGISAPTAPWQKGFVIDGGGSGSGSVTWKIAGAGESTSQTGGGTSAANTLAIFEIANGVVGPPVYNDNVTATSLTLAASAFGTGGLIIGAACSENTANLPTSITGATSNGQVNNGGVGSARSVEAFHIATPTKGVGANNVTINYGASNAIRMAACYIGAA
jgi:hypothetical protein